jgi:uncharacterized protein YdbL (DUF1318 family)
MSNPLPEPNAWTRGSITARLVSFLTFLMKLRVPPSHPLLTIKLSFLMLAYVSVYAQPTPLTPTDSVRAPGGAPSDFDLQQLWDEMKERVAGVDEILMSGCAGEAADGYLSLVPGVKLSTEQSARITEENKFRKRVYEKMAALTGSPVDEMGAQRAQRYSPRLKKGIFREVVSSAGKKWEDGFTEEERIKSYVLEFAAAPPERIEATKPFSITLQVKNALGRPASHPSLVGVNFSVASGSLSDGLIGQRTVPLVNGTAQFTSLAFPEVIKSTKLHFKGLGMLAHLQLDTMALGILEKTLTPEDVETYLPAWERRTERLLKLPPSPSRDRQLTDFRRELESGLASLQTFPAALPSTKQRLQGLLEKVTAALALAPP